MGEGKGGKENFLFSPPLPLSAPSISVALAPILGPPKSEKYLERAKKSTEMLATQARKAINMWFLESARVLLVATFIMRG